ncbi:MAG: diaminopimelate epimerase [Desulfomonile sp.]|nr:diaminopimelate epimerase [Desulfomonile sp.]
MNIAFHKMHGTLNDFVVFYDPKGSAGLTPRQVAAICHRRAGVGADGVIVVRPSAVADFFMDYINADGSLAEMCGNGIRCLAKYVYDTGLTEKTKLPVETRAGVKIVELITGEDGLVDRVRVDMGEPIFDPGSIPVTIQTDGSPISNYPVEAGGRVFHATILSMGNPHCVIFEDGNIEDLPRIYGPVIETHTIFPKKTNVEFVSVLARDRIAMRVWERGSGETYACGTGACASAVAARIRGAVDEECVVELLGGDLEIEWKGFNLPVIMTGIATKIYEGKITI